MMTNLFSCFDPCTGNVSMNWMSSIFILFFINLNFWVILNNMMNLSYLILNNLHKELSQIVTTKGSSLMFLSLFMLILLNNILGLLPYVFTSSSHIVFSLSLALPLWMTLMFYGWFMKPNYMFAHLVPSGTPSILMPMMVMIETISNFIRPGSLAVRLSANMIAGHLLMSLLGSSVSMFTMTLIMIIFIMLILFETAVSIIQSYVFMTLSTLYSSEV